MKSTLPTGTLAPCSDVYKRQVNTVYEPYTIAAEDIREVWKARVKLTTHIDELTPTFNTHAISEQLQGQQKMLETLHHHLTNSKAS